MLRGFPFHVTQSQIYIPNELMMNNNLGTSAVLKGPNGDTEAKALRNCIFEMASQAYGT